MTGFLGDNVGRAYIKIIADGKGFPESVREAYDDPSIDKAAEDAGRKHSKEYDKAFKDEFEKSRRNDKGQFDGLLSDKQIKKVNDQWRAMRDARRKVFDDDAPRLQKALSRGFQDDGVAQHEADLIASRFVTRLRKRVIESGRGFNAAKELLSDPEKFGAALREERRLYLDTVRTNEREAQRVRDRAAAVQLQRQKEQGHFLARELTRQLADRDKLYDKFFGEVGQDRVIDRVRTELTRQLKGDDATIAARRDRMLYNLRHGTGLEEAEKYIAELKRVNGRLFGGGTVVRTRNPFIRDLSDAEKRLRLLDDRVDQVGNSIGKVFGKGSRNNFLNFFGGITGGITTAALNAPVKLGRSLLRLREDMRAVRGENRGLVANLRALGEVLGARLQRGLLNIMKAVGGTIGLLNVLVLILGPLAALVSGLSAGIVALAASLSFGLVGALVAAGPLLLGLATGIGVVVSAFAGIKKLDKDVRAKLLAPLKEVKQEFRGLQADTRKGLFSDLPRQGKLLGTLLRTSIRPLFANTAKSMSGLITSLLHGFNSPAARTFFAAFDRFLNGTGKAGGVLRQFGDTLSNLLQGALVYLRLALPYASKLSTSMLHASERFRDLTGSARGENKIRRFFAESAASGHVLFETVRLLGRVIRDLFKAGRSTGDDLFSSLNDNLRRFDSFITGRGRKSVRDFFGQVMPLFHAMGSFLGGFGHFFAALDSPQSRAILNGLFEKLGQLFDFIGNLTPAIQEFQQAAGRAFAAVLKALSPIADVYLRLLASALTALTPIAEALATAMEAIDRVLGPLKPLISAIIGPLLAVTLAMKGLNLVMRLFAISSISAAGGGFFASAARSLAVNGAVLAAQAGVTATQLQKAGLLMRRAVLGLGIAFVGDQSGQSMQDAGNTVGGKLTTIGSYAFAGGLIGSVFGPLGTAAGAAAGAIVGSVRSLFQQSSAEAKRYRDAQISYLNEISDRADQIRNSLKGVNGGLRLAQRKQDVTSALGETDKKNPDAPTPLAAAESLNVNTGNLTSLLATGGDISSVYNQIEASLSNVARQSGLNSQAYKDAAAAADILRAAIRKQTLAMVEATQKQDQEDEALGRLALGARSAKRQYDVYGASLDRNTVAGRRNIEFVSDHLAAISKSARAQLLAGKSTDAVSKSFHSQVDAFRASAAAAGFNSGQIDHLTKVLLNVPGKRFVDVETQAAETKIARLTQRIRDAKQNRIPGINVNTAAGQAAIDRMQERLNSLRDRVINVSVNSNIEVGVNVSVSGAGVQARRIGTTIALAAGGILNSPQFIRPGIVAGEAGPEAVVPLNRPLGQVDPSVRWLSALAQGKSMGNGGAQKLSAGGVVGGGRHVHFEEGAIVVQTPTTDPRAVAVETINRIAASVTL